MLENENKVLQKSNEEVMREYKRKRGMEGHVSNRLVKSLSSRFLGVATCRSNGNPK